MIVFLEDDPARIREFKKQTKGHRLQIICCKTAQECIDVLSEEDIEIFLLFLDHDLGGETFVRSNRKDCGMEVVRWLEEHECFIKKIIVHSHNYPAGQDMAFRLENANYDTDYIPFCNLITRLEDFK